MKCEWCNEEITGKPVFYRTHVFCSVACKYECLAYYEVEK